MCRLTVPPRVCRDLWNRDVLVRGVGGVCDMCMRLVRAVLEERG